MKKLKSKNWEILCYAVLAIGWGALLIFDLINKDGGRAIKDCIWMLIFGFFAFGYYKFGIEKEDERDEFVKAKTEQKMYRIAYFLIVVLGTIFVIAAGIVDHNEGVTTPTMILMSIGVVLLLLWNLLTVIEIVLSIVNDRNN